MFFFLGLIVLLIGAAGALLEFTGMGKSIPGFNSIHVGVTGYVVLFAIGVVVTMMSRRPSD